MSTFLFTWNPEREGADEGWMASTVALTAGGDTVESWWSTGSRTHGIELGDRVFLLKQGVEPRGIIGSGWISTDGGVFQDEHYDPEYVGKTANYIVLEWDVMLPVDDPLPLDHLRSAAPGTNWVPQGSGQLIDDADAHVIEDLWARHTTVDGGSGSSGDGGNGKGKRGGSGREQDVVRRLKVEAYAQSWLEQEYRDAGWKVDDTHLGNPYDAIATKGKTRLYLEAKGTQTDGASVEVTIGEVGHARRHPGQCVLGIVSGIRFLENGEVDQDSGELELFERWDPDEGVLSPTRFRWSSE